MERDTGGLSEVTSELFILLAVIALAIIVGAMIFGVFRPVDKTAYLVPQFNITTVSGNSVIQVFDRGGDPVYFNNSPKAIYKAELYVDTQWGAYKAVPVPSLTLFQPGDAIYVYNTGTGFAMSSNLSGTGFNSLPAGTLSVRLIDATSNVLIAKEDLVTVPVTTTAATTATTSTTKTTVTTVVTSPTATTPTTLPSLAANFDFTVGKNGKLVAFTDRSTGNPTSWSWDFGDGNKVKGTQNPNNNYNKAGTWTVTLTVTRSSDGATSMITKSVTTT